MEVNHGLIIQLVEANRPNTMVGQWGRQLTSI